MEGEPEPPDALPAVDDGEQPPEAECRTTPHNGRPRSAGAIDIVATAIAGGSTVREAADAAKVNERTVWRWLKQSTFTDRVNGIREEMVRQAVDCIRSGMTKAAKKLFAIMDSPNATAAIQLRAAQLILELGPKLHGETELKAQIEELELRLTESGR